MVLSAAAFATLGGAAHAAAPCTPFATVTAASVNWLYCGMPDLDQVRGRSEIFGDPGLPRSGINYCVPTAVMNVYAELVRRGQPVGLAIPAVDWTEPTNFRAMTGHIRGLGQLMKTNPNKGTTADNALAALTATLGAEQTVGHIYSAESARGDSPDPRDLAIDGAAGAFVLPIIGFYDAEEGRLKDGSIVPIKVRKGGHAMTAIGATAGMSGPIKFTVHDPATDWVLDTVQSPYTGETHALTPATLRVFKYEDLPDGGWKTSFDRFERWIWDGDENVLYDGFIKISRRSAWVVVDKKLRVIRPHPLAPVAANVPTTFSLPGGGEAVDIALSGTSSKPLVVSSKGSRVWELNPATGAAERFADVAGATAVAVGGPSQNVYIAGQNRLISLTGSGRQIASRKLATPLSSLEYDNARGGLVAVTRDGSKLQFFKRSLKPAGARALRAGRNAQLAVGPRGTIVIAATGGGQMWTLPPAKTPGARPTARRLKRHKLERRRAIRGVAVDDNGHIIVTQRGRLVEYTAGGELVKDSLLTGSPATRVLAVSRSFSNGGGPMDLLPNRQPYPQPIPHR